MICLRRFVLVMVHQVAAYLVQAARAQESHFGEFAVAVVVHQVADEIRALLENVTHLLAQSLGILALEEVLLFG